MAALALLLVYLLTRLGVNGIEGEKENEACQYTALCKSLKQIHRKDWSEMWIISRIGCKNMTGN
jgi:hypothetical protein